MYFCEYCGRECLNAGGNGAHVIRCKKNPNRDTKPRKTRKRETQWNSGTGRRGENQYTKARRLGLPDPEISQDTRIKLRLANLGKTHSEETKSKISKSRIRFLDENPHMVPYKLNHYSNGPSYPERYWKSILDENLVDYVEQYSIGKYQLDFAILNEKIDLEIDGDQHYLDDRIAESDKRRDAFMRERGWEVIRVRWSEFKKLTEREDRERFVDRIIDQLK